MYKYILIFSLLVPPLSAQANEPHALTPQVSLNSLSHNMTSQVFPYLSPVDRKLLYDTGDKIIQSHIRKFERYSVDKIIASNADKKLVQKRKKLCAALPVTPEDYGSIYNIIINFDRIVEIAENHKLQNKINSFGFEKILTRSVINFMVSLRNEKAIALKFFGRLEGKYGYHKNINRAHIFLRTQSQLNSPIASSLLFDGLLYGYYFMTPNAKEAADLITSQIEAQETWAISKVWRIIYEQQNQELARDFLLQQAKLGNRWALQTFLETEANFLYMDTSEKKQYKRDLIEQQVNHGYPWANLAKLKAISQGYYGHESPKSYARDFLMKAVNKGESWAIPAYLDGLKHGYYGIEKNHKMLREYVDGKCREGNLTFIREKYDLHVSAYHAYAWDDKSIPKLLAIAARQGESWAIIEILS